MNTLQLFLPCAAGVEGYLAAEIERGVCYVVMGEGAIQAVFCLIPGDEPTYRIMEDGAWPEDLPYATIHRMASAGQVRGIGQFCIDWCLRQGLPVRADTHADNVYMQRALEKRPVSVERAYEFLSTVRDTAGKSRGHAALRKLRRVDEIVRREPELFAHEGPLPRMRATYHEHHRSMPPATSMASIASSAHCRNHPAKSPVTPPKRDRATWRYHASAKSPATAIRAPTA